MIITPATATDLPVVRQLLAECKLPFEDLTPGHLESFIIARDADHIVATGGLEIAGHSALLRSLAVTRQARNQHLGRELLNQLESLARQFDVDALFLLTNTAVDFFKRRGYITIERTAAPDGILNTREFSELCPASSTCMTRTLEQ